MTKQLRIGHSPLSNSIYIGHVNQDGQWAKNQTNVTEDAIACVALCIEKEGGELTILKEENGKTKPAFTITVKRM